METQNKNQLKPVSIRKIFHEKNPRLARLIPGFIYNYLRRITHEDFVNEVIRDYGHLRGFDFSEAVIKRFNVDIEIEGIENIPKEGKYIFVSNHPLGGFDGHILMYIIGQIHKDYKFLVNDILMHLSNLNDVFIPINKHGKQGSELVKAIDAAYSSDAQILSFPAGLVSRRIKGQIVDLAWQKNFISKAKQHQRDVIPIHMSGRNTDFFYKLGSIRKKLGIQANIEMLYLIDETFKHQNKKFVVKFGKPIKWQTFDKTKKPAEWAKWVKEASYKLDGVDSIPL